MKTVRIAAVSLWAVQELSLPECRLTGTVHSVYQHICNIKLGDRLLSWQDETCIRSPLSFVLGPGLDLSALRLKQGDFCWLDPLARQFMVGDWLLNFQHAATFSLQYANADKYIAGLAAAVLRIRAAVTQETGDLYVKGIGAQISVAVRQGLQNLAMGISLRSRPIFLQGVRQLVGLGFGLTPTGDDALLGFILAMELDAANRSFISGLTADILSWLPGRTTEISEQFLRLGLQSHYAEPPLSLLQSLYHGDATAQTAAIEQVLGIGHSSGGDLLTGLAAGLQCLVEHQPNGSDNLRHCAQKNSGGLPMTAQ